MRNSHEVLVAKSEGRIYIYIYRWTDTIKMELKNSSVCGCELDSSESR
jgi:hypothetical protein